MARAFWLRYNGKIFGPFDQIEIRQMADSGALRAEMEISPDSVRWKLCGEVNGLLRVPDKTASKPPEEQFPSTAGAHQLGAPESVPLQPETAQLLQPDALPMSNDDVPPIAETSVDEAQGGGGWFYKINGEQAGPVPEAEIIVMIRNRTLTAHNIVWIAGMGKWERLEEVPIFKNHINRYRQFKDDLRLSVLLPVFLKFAAVLVIVAFYAYYHMAKQRAQAQASLPPMEQQPSQRVTAGTTTRPDFPQHVQGQWMCVNEETMPSIVEIEAHKITEYNMAVGDMFEHPVVGMVAVSVTNPRGALEDLSVSLTIVGSSFTDPEMQKLIDQRVPMNGSRSMSVRGNEIFYPKATTSCHRINISPMVAQLKAEFDLARKLARQKAAYAEQSWFVSAAMVRTTGYCKGFRDDIIKNGLSNASIGSAVADRLLPILEQNGCLISDSNDAMLPDFPSIPNSTLSLDALTEKLENSVPTKTSGERFVQAGDAMLKDTKTGLIWTQSDNGSDVNWNEAHAYCAGKGLALPSVDELAAIYQSGSGAPCGDYTCKVSALFRLSSPGGYYWSATANGSGEAWVVALDTGGRPSGTVSDANGERALCVRRS